MKHTPLQGTQDLPSGGENATVPWSAVKHSTWNFGLTWGLASREGTELVYSHHFPSGYPVRWFVSGCLVWQWNCQGKNRKLFEFSLVLKTLKLSSLGFGDIRPKKAHELFFGTVTCCTIVFNQEWSVYLRSFRSFSAVHGKSPMPMEWGICQWHSASATSKLSCLRLRQSAEVLKYW